MEFMAGVTHKYVMHGFLWTLHKDHHCTHQGFFEQNDHFFLLLALPGCLLLVFGSLGGFDFRYWIGLGITLYGLTYFIIHDLLIHQRIKRLPKAKATYLKALIKAHEAHHKLFGKDRGTCFGLLFFPWKYYSQARED